MSSKAYQFIWFPSNLLDRIANIIILFIILALFVIGFDYAKAPTFDLAAIRSVVGVRVFAALLLAALGIVVTWGLAREEYVMNERALLPAVSAYALLATGCSLAWLVRGIFSMTPYVLTTSRPIDWAVFLEIIIGGQLLAVLNIGTLYYKKGDGATVRAFANSYALAQKLLQQLFSHSTPVNVREALIPSATCRTRSRSCSRESVEVAAATACSRSRLRPQRAIGRGQGFIGRIYFGSWFATIAAVIMGSMRSVSSAPTAGHRTSIFTSRARSIWSTLKFSSLTASMQNWKSSLIGFLETPTRMF